MELIISRYLKTIEQYIFRMIGKNKAEGKKMIIIVPSQASFLMEKNIIEQFGGFCDTEVMSFEKLTHTILLRSGGCALPKMDSIGEGIRIRRILEEHADEMRLFSGENDEELHMKLAESISSISAEGISPEELEELSNKATGQLSDKLHDIGFIYNELVNSIGKELTPNMTELYAASQVPEAAFLKEAKIIIHGFELLTQNKLHMIKFMLLAGCDITMTLEADEEDEVFCRQNMLKIKIDDIARAAGKSLKLTKLNANISQISSDIAFLEDAIYAFPIRRSDILPENIEIVCLKDRREEAEFISSRILSEVDMGIRLRDMGLLSPTEPNERIKEALRTCNINFTAQSKRKLIKHRLCDFILSAVKVIYNGRWSMESITEYLKTKMLLGQEQTDALIKYAEENGLKGYSFKQPVANEEIEKLRKIAVEPLVLLMNQKDAARACRELREYILKSDIPEKLEAESLMLEKYGKQEEAKFTSQVVGKVCDVLLQTAESAANMDKKLLYPLLLCGFNSAELAIVPPATDEIVLGEITHSIFSYKKLMIISGANDGSLPAPPPSGIFTTDELEALNREVFFPGLSLSEDQRIYIRRALSSADKLIITYTERDGAPSTVIERIRKIFPNMPIHRAEEYPACSHPAVALAGAKELRMAMLGEQTTLHNAAAIFNSEDNSYIKKAILYDNRPEQLKRETAAKLYGKELNSSVTRIERYKSCPYRHFIDYGLRPKSIRKLEEDSRMAGTYVHGMMDRLAKAIKKQGEDWGSISDSDIEKLTEEAAAEMREQHNLGYFTMDKQAARIEERLKSEIVFAAKSIRHQLKDCKAQIASTEKKFGSNGELTISAENGSINIQGVVDRVDIAVAEDGSRFLRIVDYKTGQAASKYSINEVFYGIRIQLIVYLMAALNIYRDCMPAGGFYFHIDMPFTKYSDDKRFMDMRMDGFLIDDKEAALLFDNTGSGMFVSMKKSLTTSGDVRGGITKDDMELLMKYTKRLITQAVEEIFDGKADIYPYHESSQNNACMYCDYRAICRFDESYAANRKNIAKSRNITDMREAAKDEDDR